MSRPLRPDFADSRFHVVNKGVNGQPIFFGDADRVEFGRLLGEIRERFGTRVLAYCLMTNHFHLVLHCPNGGLSAAIQHLCGVFARHVNDRAGREGHLFGRRFYSSVIDSDRYLLGAIRYVERNALDLPGVTSTGDHRWSSYRANSGLKAGPASLDSSAVKSYFRNDDAYRRFVDAPVTTEEPRILALNLIDDLIELALHLAENADVGARQARSIKIALADRLNDQHRNAVIESLELPSRAALRLARQRAERCAHQLTGFVELVEHVRSRLIDVSGLTPDVAGSWNAAA